jgi:glutamyl-tRNA synthetase
VAGESFTVDPEAAAKQFGDGAADVLAAAVSAVETVDPFVTPDIETALRAALVDGLGLKPRHAFGPVRVAVTGSTVSPPLFESIELLGREVTLQRLRSAQASL